jgi:type I restriction enzyme S subunit
MRKGWEAKKLGEVCAFDKQQGSHSNLPYVGLEHIESDTGRFLGVLDAFSVKSNTFHFSPKHILYGRLRPYLNKVLLPDFEGHCSTEIFPIKPANGLSREFLFYWLSQDVTVKAIDATSTGARMPRANMNVVLDFKIPVPPLPEQKRIVAVLAEAFEGIAAAVANAEKNLANARELFESYLNSVFIHRGKGWVEKTIDDIAHIKGGKRVPKGYKLTAEPTNHPYISVSDFNENGGIDLDAIRYISDDVYDEIKRYTISPDNLYISIAGTIGKTGIIPKQLDGANLTENACKLVFKGNVYNKFIYYFTRTSSFADQALLNTRVAAQPKLALERLKTIKLSLPEKPDQVRIANDLDALLEETQKLEAIYQQKLDNLAELKQTILQKAFAGELTTQPKQVLQEAVA